ncbi:MAG: thymidine phosphorylase family protein [Chitinophagaceae bacterium]|nr:thymidine phosphorylase family protein [Chitinophagaceae bacterium]
MKVINQHTKHSLRFRDLGIDTNQELVVFMPASCHVCKSEGFQALTRLSVSFNGSAIIAALNITSDGLLHEGEISLSKSAIQKLKVKDNDLLQVAHIEALQSMTHVRAKLYGNVLNQQQYDEIIQDIADEKYSNIFLSSFVAACSGTNMKLEEICSLTVAMIKAGNKLEWGNEVIADKHCVGGLPGNRTTMIVVPIIASLGIMIPKTSSRAITSPAGTADTMEVLTNVNLSLAQMRKVVEKENGCIVWGGSMKLSPADDIIIKVERALDIDSEGQMIASILSKKAAAGATDCVIDIPVGATAKVRTVDDAISLTLRLKRVADYIGLNIQTICSNGEQPVGYGIGPSLEARDVLAVLQNATDAPKDLRQRAITIATEIIKLVWNMEKQPAEDLVIKQIDSGEAFDKLISICEAQGEFHEPKKAKYCKIIESAGAGIISEIDNRKIARIAKLAGAPDSAEAGIDFLVQLNQDIGSGQPLFTIHANSPGELEYAYEYYKQNEKQLIKLSYE